MPRSWVGRADADARCGLGASFGVTRLCRRRCAGKELLKLNEDEPMQPVDDWMLLRGNILGRTGLPVMDKVKKSILSDSHR